MTVDNLPLFSPSVETEVRIIKEQTNIQLYTIIYKPIDYNFLLLSSW